MHQLFLPLGRSGGPAGVRAVRDRLRTCARTNVGADALIVAGDRGQSAPQVYEHNTSRGVGTVIPYRRKNGSSPKQAEATDEWDEYGIPFCRHCKSGGDFVRFSVADGRARLWFECSMPQRAGCDRIQSISCGKDYTRLLPLWRTMDAYAVMRETHGEYERIHNLERVRYLVGPDQLSNPAEADRDWHTAAALQRGRVPRVAAHLPPAGVDRPQGTTRQWAPHRPRRMLDCIGRQRRAAGRTGGGRRKAGQARPQRQPPPADDDRPF